MQTVRGNSFGYLAGNTSAGIKFNTNFMGAASYTIFYIARWAAAVECNSAHAPPCPAHALPCPAHAPQPDPLPPPEPLPLPRSPSLQP